MCEYCNEVSELAEQGEDAFREGITALMMDQVGRMAAEISVLMDDVRPGTEGVPMEHERVANLSEKIGMRLSIVYGQAQVGRMAEHIFAQSDLDAAEIWEQSERAMSEQPPSMLLGIMAGEFLKSERARMLDELGGAIMGALFGFDPPSDN